VVSSVLESKLCHFEQLIFAFLGGIRDIKSDNIDVIFI